MQFLLIETLSKSITLVEAYLKLALSIFPTIRLVGKIYVDVTNYEGKARNLLNARISSFRIHC